VDFAGSGSQNLNRFFLSIEINGEDERKSLIGDWSCDSPSTYGIGSWQPASLPTTD
jgi:hypothetical protein